jgi:hypothetical protein
VLTGLNRAANAPGADGLLVAGLAGAIALSAYGRWIRTSGANKLLILGFLPCIRAGCRCAIGLEVVEVDQRLGTPADDRGPVAGEALQQVVRSMADLGDLLAGSPTSKEMDAIHQEMNVASALSTVG